MNISWCFKLRLFFFFHEIMNFTLSLKEQMFWFWIHFYNKTYIHPWRELGKYEPRFPSFRAEPHHMCWDESTIVEIVIF